MQKRFVAGAVCPACQAMDKIVVLLGREPQVRECVACGYSDCLDENGNIQELATRVNQPIAGERNVAFQDDVQVIEIK